MKSKVSLSILDSLTNLEILFTYISKDIETVAKLTNLRAVSLNEIKNNNLDFLSNLNNLRTVWVSLGSYDDFRALSRIQNLEKLRIHQVRGFDDETANFVLPKCKSLRALKLENLKHITKLDFVEQMSNLKYLSFDGIKNIESYLPIKTNTMLTTIAGANCRPSDKLLKGLEQVENVGLGDSYSKPEVDRFLNESAAKNIWIRGNSFRGRWEPINPFEHVD